MERSQFKHTFRRPGNGQRAGLGGGGGGAD